MPRSKQESSWRSLSNTLDTARPVSSRLTNSTEQVPVGSISDVCSSMSPSTLRMENSDFLQKCYIISSVLFLENSVVIIVLCIHLYYIMSKFGPHILFLNFLSNIIGIKRISCRGSFVLKNSNVLYTYYQCGYLPNEETLQENLDNWICFKSHGNFNNFKC